MKTLTLIIALLIAEVSHSYCQYWEPLGGGVHGFGTVVSLCVDTFHHKLYAGGAFDSIGSIKAHNIAVWNGNEWQKLSYEPSEPIVGMVMKHDTMIYATGAKIDSQVGMFVDTNFVGLLNKVGNYIHCIYLFKDTLYVGGEFNGGIKYWNGSQWQLLGGGIDGPFYQVETIGEYNGQLIVGGHFSLAGGVAVNNITAWDGSEWHTLGDGITGTFPQVYDVQEFNGELYVGGDFQDAGGVYTGSIAKWDGSNWDTVYLSPYGYSCGQFYDFYKDDNVLYAGGTMFADLDCIGNRAAMFNGSNWYNMNLSTGNYAFAMAVFNGEVIAGGNIEYGIDNDTINCIAHFIGSIPTSAQVLADFTRSIIYPNPTSTTITISLPSNQNATLTIFNLLGEKVKQEQVTGNEATLDVSKLPAGMYVVRSNENLIGKFVKLAYR